MQWGAAEQETAGRETTGQETTGQEMVEQRNRYKENPPQIFSRVFNRVNIVFQQSLRGISYPPPLLSIILIKNVQKNGELS